MSDNLRHWILENEVKVDSLGRIIINDENITKEINGAVNAIAADIVGGDMGCGAGCGELE